MKVVDTDSLRTNWGTYLTAAGDDDNTAYAVTFRGRPEAVLLSVPSWEYGRKRVPVDSSRRTDMAADPARTDLRRRREAARRGEHTVIERFGEPTAVLAPYDWVREALPELGEAAPKSTTAGRYGAAGGQSAGEAGAAPA